MCIHSEFKNLVINYIHVGRVFVGLKCSIFEPYSPFRHMTEIHKLIQADPSSSSKPILFLYTDEGPDHRITYISVQISLICLFLKLDLDYLVVVELPLITVGGILWSV